jgi:hypothetical protein
MKTNQEFAFFLIFWTSPLLEQSRFFLFSFFLFLHTKSFSLHLSLFTPGLRGDEACLGFFFIFFIFFVIFYFYSFYLFILFCLL